MSLELVKENIEYEQILGENTADNVIKGEYVIPDTHPDVSNIIMLDAKPSVVSSEIIQDKIYVEGQIVYDVLYTAKSELFSVSYIGKFSNYIEISGAANKMLSEIECNIEHISCSAMNERKIAIEGIVKTSVKLSRSNSFEIVKDIKEDKDVQILKQTAIVDKLAGESKIPLIGKAHITIPLEKPEINSILKLDASLHKREVKTSEGKVQASTFMLVDVFYKGNTEKELEFVSEDIFVNGEVEIIGVNSLMNASGNFNITNIDYNLKDDDLGEKRVLDIEVNINVDIKVMTKENLPVIEDLYSSEILINIVKQEYALNIVHGTSSFDNIVKENIQPRHEIYKPKEIILSKGKVTLSDKKLVENKILLEAILSVNVLYKTSDEDNLVDAVEEEIPFSCSAEIPGTKIHMNSEVKLFLESLEGSIEAGTIAIKAVVNAEAKVNYEIKKEFIVNVEAIEGEKPVKKSSISIYCVQTGDTLWKIAKRFCTTSESLMKTNMIQDSDNINIGQKLIIPGRSIM